MTYTEEQLNKLFLGIAFDLQEAIKDKMEELNIRFSSDGISSVQVVVKKNKLVITMNDYLEYIEYGLPNPTTPEELYDWVEQKLLDDYKGKNKERAKIVIAENIAEHITHFGPRPNPFLRTTLHTELPKIIKRNINQFQG